jgi:hypothetical protein
MLIAVRTVGVNGGGLTAVTESIIQIIYYNNN